MDRHRIGELAKRTGVSVRTLHHYDRIGLVRPSARSEAGYRLYASEDVLRLQQVLTLRYFGFKLDEIRTMLDEPGLDVAKALDAQRRTLRGRAEELMRIETALSQVMEHFTRQGDWSWDLMTDAAAAVQNGLRDPGGEQMMKDLYTEEQMRQFAELGERVGQDEIRAVEEAWKELVTEIRSKMSLDPASPEAQALAERWDALHERTIAPYRDYPDLLNALRANYNNNRFDETQPGFAGHNIRQFIDRVHAARKA